MPDSSAQRSFLQKHKKRQQFIRLMRIAVFLVFLIVWEISARLGLIDSFIFGSPSQVCLAFRALLLTNHLLSHIGITVFETLASFFLVVGFSLFFSVLLWLCPRLAAILEPYLVVLNSLPKSALAPLLIVWLGANYKTIILAGISVAIFRLHPESLYQFYGNRSRFTETHSHARRKTQRRIAACGTALFGSLSSECYEGQYRSLSGRCGDR